MISSSFFLYICKIDDYIGFDFQNKIFMNYIKFIPLFLDSTFLQSVSVI